MPNKIKIAIIEDDVFIAESMKLLVEDMGYEVSFVSHTFPDATQQLTQTPFDLLLLDINLQHPTHSGIDIAAALSAGKSLPFIFLTAYSDRDTIMQAVKQKPSAYLVKPVNEGALFAAIQTALENHQTQTAATLPYDETNHPDHFFTKMGNKIMKIKWADVYALTAAKNYVCLITDAQPGGYAIRSSLQQIIAQIVPCNHRSRYIQVNRSTAIDKNIITSLTGNEVITCKGNFELGSGFAKEVKKQLNIL